MSSSCDHLISAHSHGMSAEWGLCDHLLGLLTAFEKMDIRLYL
jgi:hypothetical protein